VSSALGDARDLIDIALDAIIAIDEHGMIVEWNRGAEATFGWTRDAALGRRLADTIVPERYREAHTRGLAHYVATGEGPLIGKRVEIEALHEDGREIPVEISILARRSDGAYTFIAFVRDISDRRAGEHAIRESSRLLERDRARSELLSNVSHELRTPLNAVLGFNELLEEQVGPSLTDAQRRYLRNVREAGEGLLDLVNDVLELSTLEPGPSALNVEPIDLVALLSPVIAEARRAADKKGLTLGAAPIPSATVSIDARRIRRVLDDLMSNAVKFTPEGGIVSLRSATDGTVLTLEVSDTGIGIPPEMHDRAFAMFERVHEGRHASSGTGLGLHLVKRIVELHAGTITFRSEGRGTTFNIRLAEAVEAAGAS
jgi:PAS domain S-box-containing protein